MSAISALLRFPTAQPDFDALVARIRGRLYPESMPVLVSYWLKTVCARNHSRAWWKELDGLLTNALREKSLDQSVLEVLNEVHRWIQSQGALTGNGPTVSAPGPEPFRPNLRPEWLAPHIARLLNEWLTTEVANLLVSNVEWMNEPEFAADSAMPPLVMGRALEQLLVRERLSPGTLEMFLRPDVLSPHYIYPAHAEMLRDVVLFLLGRTAASPVPVLPAMLLGVAAGSPLPPDFGDAIESASLTEVQGVEELRVPIAAHHAHHVLECIPTCIGATVVTTDGRWWESENLDSGERHSVIFRSQGRLQIDYSGEQANLKLPWPDTQLHWTGGMNAPDTFEIFGREWRLSSWENDGERTWLNMVFSRPLRMPEPEAVEETSFRRSVPAFVDMAWSALGNALANVSSEKDLESVEQLRRSEFVPLARAIVALTGSMSHLRLPKHETLEAQLRAIRYHEAELSPVYGRVPWGVLPPLLRTALSKRRLDPTLRDMVNEIFDSVPESLAPASESKPPGSQPVASPSPSQAA